MEFAMHMVYARTLMYLYWEKNEEAKYNKAENIRNSVTIVYSRGIVYNYYQHIGHTASKLHLLIFEHTIRAICT